MACLAAPICGELLRQVNARYPKRERGSDGVVGDASHMTGTGDHTCKTTQYYNPGRGLYVAGYAHAVDLDEDGWPAAAFYAFTMAEAVAGRRPWIKYSIYEDVLRDRYRKWAKQVGFGHTKHMHFSIDGGRPVAWTRKTPDWFAGWDTSPFNPDYKEPVMPYTPARTDVVWKNKNGAEFTFPKYMDHYWPSISAHDGEIAALKDGAAAAEQRATDMESVVTQLRADVDALTAQTPPEGQ
jgi:hypothetical protein